MKTVLDTSDRPAHDALVEKKSEFIADVCHVDALDEALLFVDSVRQLHPKARHVAYAAICVDGDGRVRERMSDDGEPSGTAGKPILDVLRANEMTDCVVAVTRYFGGILLGAGGLTRAYSKGARDALAAAGVATMGLWARVRLSCPYPLFERVKLEIAAADGVLDDMDYGADVTLTVSLPSERRETLQGRLTELSAGGLTLALMEESYRPGPREEL